MLNVLSRLLALIKMDNLANVLKFDIAVVATLGLDQVR